MTITLSEELSNLLCEHGIADSYIGYAGECVEIPVRDRIAILAAKGTDVMAPDGQADANTISQALKTLHKSRWKSILPPVQIAWPVDEDADQTISIPLILPGHAVAQQFIWTLRTEQGSHREDQFCPEELIRQQSSELEQAGYQRYLLPLCDINRADLPEGYHQFSLKSADESPQSHLCATMLLIVAPPCCHELASVVGDRRLWGFSVQLYSVRSENNWGLGDFGDLGELTRLAAGNGADYLILNPLHAGDAANPAQCSPYSPSDRRRLNPLYLDISSEPEFLSCVEADPTLSDTLRPHIAQLNQTTLVDYTAVSELKYQVFDLMYAAFLKKHAAQLTPRFHAFQRYMQREQPALQQFVQWQADNPPLVSAPLVSGQDTTSHARDPDFYAYLQWLTENQLEQCHQNALSLGMRVGLIRDLAVGSDVTGAEVTMNPQAFCCAASIGAPPDPLAPQGQNWGLPPLDPRELQQSAYAHFITLLRTNMSHCGALRIDHVMSLMRLWWCTAGGDSGEGAYVHYPVRDLFALLCLESRRNHCMVIGEDLGVVPPAVRHYLAASGIFSNTLFYFEKHDGVHFRRPEHYPVHALCMVANHDVPTLAAWWNGSDLKLRRKLNLIGNDSELQTQWQARQEELQHVCSWLEAQWLLPATRFGEGAGAPFDQALGAAIMQCCARGRSMLLSVQLDDLVMEQTPVNIPGTSAEYPNWRRKLPLTLLETLGEHGENSMLNAIRRERPGP